MKCYHCGSEYVKDPNTGRMICPICEHWKPGYQWAWKQHKDKVLRLKEELEHRFPEITVVLRHGADSEDWIDIFPDEKHEPDMDLWLPYKRFGHVEVTGPSWYSLPPQEDIWVLPGKLRIGKSKEALGEKYWLYITYKNKTFALRTQDVIPFEHNVFLHNIRGNIENYIHIPQNKAFPADMIFDWISEVINKLKRDSQEYG